MPGDDIRHIDWRLTGRQADGSLQVRVRHKDVTPNMWVISDVLASRYESDTDQYYREQNLGLSAIMATMRIGDIVGMPTAAIVADGRGLVVPQSEPMRGRRHLYRVASSLAGSVLNQEQGHNEARNPLTDALQYASRTCVQNMVVIVSDFRGEAHIDGQDPSWKKPLSKIKSKGNDLLAIELVDPLDFKLRDTADRYRDAGHNMGIWVGNDKQGKQIREKYAEQAQAKSESIKQSLKAVGAHHLQLRTDNPRWRDDFRRQLRSRRRIR